MYNFWLAFVKFFSSYNFKKNSICRKSIVSPRLYTGDIVIALKAVTVTFND